MTPIINLTNSFPLRYKLEIASILEHLDLERIATTIEELSGFSPNFLGEIIKNSTPPAVEFIEEMFQTTINNASGDSTVEEILINYIIGDINDPRTRLAQERADMVWEYFISLFDNSRQKVMRVIASGFQDNLEFGNPSHSFHQFSILDESDFINILTDLFYVSYAEYLINEAKRYLEVNRHSYLAFGKIVESGSSLPIRKAKITARSTSGVTFSGWTYSNFEGNFSISFDSLTRITGSKSIQIRIEKEGYNSKNTSITFKSADTYSIKTITLSKKKESLTAAIKDVKEDLEITVPQELNLFFIQNKIDTLADIRNIGLLQNQTPLINELPNNIVLKQFDSLALFELIDQNYNKNNKIIAAGYASFTDIALIPRTKFIENFHSDFESDYEALMYYEASNQLSLTVMNEIYIPRDKFNPPPINQNLKNNDICGCSDCEAATGPMAYLADLTSFVFENIETPTGNIDSRWIEEHLFRNFTSLPIACSELENSVCQTRIATEVLQSLAGSNIIVPSPSAITVYNKGVIEYLIQSYEAILIKLGTSYNELRDYQSVADIESRKNYAHRLGIVLDDNYNVGETISNMFKERTAFTENDITFLQNYFGLEPTEAFGNSVIPFFKLWKIERLKEVWGERDRVKTAFESREKVIIDPDIVSVDDFRFFKDDPVEYRIWKKRRAFIDGVYNGFVSIEPTESTTRIEEIALILEGTTGFTYAPESGSPIHKSKIWSSNSIIEIESLVHEMRQGDKESGSTLWEDYSLRPDAAIRLIELLKLEQKGDGLTREEFIEACNICVQVVKHVFGNSWINEEDDNQIELSSKMFWKSEREPIQGEWPIIMPITSPATPIIDPESISLGGIPEATFCSVTNLNPETVYYNRISELNEIKDFLTGQDPNEQAGYIDTIAQKVDYAFMETNYVFENPGANPPDEKTFVFLNNQLNNPAETSIAKTVIENELKLAVEDFIFIMGLATKFANAPVDLSQAESDRLYSILISSRKVFSKFQEWTTEDSASNYWELRKAQLPIWRASVEKRAEWQEALQLHNSPPIIDADLIGPAYLVDPTTGNRAFDLWLERYKEMHDADGWYKEISEENPFNTPAGHNLQNYKLLVDKYLIGNSGVSFYDSLKEREKSENISPVLEQLLLTTSQYRFLMDLGKKFEFVSNFEISQEELDRLYYTLALNQKKKEYYRYKLEEADSTEVAITKSPDFFVSRDADYTTYPPSIPYSLNPYLVSEQQLSAWRKVISSRTEEENKLELDYDTMLLETDGDTMGFLRDALVELLDESNNSTSEKARKLGDRLLIDLQNNCCTKTNRVATAIETMQQLIWKTYTGDILSEYDLSISTHSFDTVWEWMGSYANWRASMFVFLYPENILLPSLKSKSTPAFLNLVSETQNNRNFNPGMACEIVEDYRQYIADVNSLSLKSSVETTIITQKENVCAGESQIAENLTFVFAMSENSGRSYYTVVKPDEDDFDQKTFWTKIPKIHDKAIIKGSDVYWSDKRGLHFIYVFYVVDAFDLRNKFYAIRFDVNKNEWESEPLEFEISNEELTFIFVGENISINPWSPSFNLWWPSKEELSQGVDETILEIKVLENSYRWQTPKIAVSLKILTDKNSVKKETIVTFTRSLAADGTMLNDGESKYDKWLFLGTRSSLAHSEDLPFPNRNSMTGKIKRFVFIQGDTPTGDPNDLWHGYNEYLLMDDEVGVGRKLRMISRDNLLNFKLQTQKSKVPVEDIISTNKYGPMLGVFDLEDSSGSKYKEVLLPDLDFEDPAPFFLNNSFLFAGYNGKLGGNGYKRTFVYQEEGGLISITKMWFNVSTSKPVFSDNSYPLTPKMNEIPAFDNSLTRSELELLRTQSETNILANIDDRNPKLRIYAEESYYFVPVMIASKLSDNGYYAEALKWYRLVYDYLAGENNRKIYFGLVLEESYESLQDRIAEWYEDPLNPHAIAATRQNAYTRYTIMSIGATLLAYANAEFTKDDSESNPRARELYEDIIDLMSVLDTKDPCDTEEKILSLSSYLDDSLEDENWRYKWKETFMTLRALRTTPSELDTLIDDILGELDRIEPEHIKFKEVQTLIQEVKDQITVPKIIDKVENLSEDIISKIGISLVGGQLESVFRRGKDEAHSNTTRNLKLVTGYSQGDFTRLDLTWLYTDTEATQSKDLESNPVANVKQRTIQKFAKSTPQKAYEIISPYPELRISGMPYLFCVVPNPTVSATLLTAHLNLHKIHNCMNIAGMVRELRPFAAPTDATTGIPSIGAGGVLQLPGQSSIAPTNYRYGFLVERAKQMVSIAQQMESSMLQSLEKFDAESYAQFRAEQDLELAKAGIKLQDLKVKEAQSNKTLAELQKDRAQIQLDGLQGMMDEGLLGMENELINNYFEFGKFQQFVAAITAVEEATKLLVIAAAGGFDGAAATPLAVVAGVSAFSKSLLNIKIADIQTTISINSIYASLQRRMQEWSYQKSIASQDMEIGSQQIRIADDRIRITGQERAIATLQQDQAVAVLDFLKTKFTNAELYEWMSGVLEDVYSYFLQEATAMSKLAEQQLAFERQVDLPNLIKSDYWNMASNTALTIGASTSENDRKGLTGSARLLKDLSQLEQYAIDTNQRKLQITKTLSLNEHDPVQMEMFRDSGVLRFTTTLRDFDWDFPGHYLRLIRRVSVTVIALTPPNKGIKATLINSGISSVVINTGNIFQKRLITRSPERIALSSPYNEYGMFQLETNDAMYRPFEGSGVETLWELQMEKASNPFDYRSIADVLITIEYDALENDLYSKTIKNQLNNENKNASLVLSLRNDLPDQWYELMNPNTGSGATQFKIRKSDLPPNVLSNSLTAVKAYLSFDIEKLKEDEIITQDYGGQINITTSIEGNLEISKNSEESSVEMPINNFLLNQLQKFESFPNIEQPIEGDWYLRLSQTTDVIEMINKEHLQDIVIILEYAVTTVKFS